MLKHRAKRREIVPLSKQLQTALYILFYIQWSDLSLEISIYCGYLASQGCSSDHSVCDTYLGRKPTLVGRPTAGIASWTPCGIQSFWHERVAYKRGVQYEISHSITLEVLQISLKQANTQAKSSFPVYILHTYFLPPLFNFPLLLSVTFPILFELYDGEDTEPWPRFTYMKLAVQNAAWRELVQSKSAGNERLIYEGYSSLRNQWMGLPTHQILRKRTVYKQCTVNKMCTYSSRGNYCRLNEIRDVAMSWTIAEIEWERRLGDSSIYCISPRSVNIVNCHKSCRWFSLFWQPRFFPQ